MTTDPFIEVARAEAWRRHPAPVDVETGEPVDDWGFEEEGRRDFMAGAEWARAHLSAEMREAKTGALRSAARDIEASNRYLPGMTIRDVCRVLRRRADDMETGDGDDRR